MAQNTEEEIKALKARLKAAQGRLTAEKAEARRIERENRLAALKEKTAKFREQYATEAIGEDSEWIDVYSNSIGTEIAIYEYDVPQFSFHLTLDQAKKLRDVLNKTYPA